MAKVWLRAAVGLVDQMTQTLHPEATMISTCCIADLAKALLLLYLHVTAI